MSKQFVLPTARDGVELRQLSVEDAPAYSAAVSESGDHLRQFGDKTADKYPDLLAVVDSFYNPANAGKSRFGIYDDNTFAGSINLTPKKGESAAEIGYWLHVDRTGKGLATVAVKALSAHAAQDYERVFAEVTEGNEASARVLERAGFQQTCIEAGTLIFELVRAPLPQRITHKDTERFVRPGFTGDIYVPKEAGRGFNILNIEVDGSHPKKQILEGNTRSYFVVDGVGEFVLDGVRHPANKGDLFIIPEGSEYEYCGKMRLLEVNVSPDNSFGDRKL